MGLRESETNTRQMWNPCPLYILGSANNKTMWNSVSVSTPSLTEVVRCCEPVPYVFIMA